MKRDLLFIAERLASLLDENRLFVVARRYGIKKAKDTDSLGKLFAAYLRRAEENVLGSVLVETTILYMSTRHNPAQVLNEAAAVYKVDTDVVMPLERLRGVSPRFSGPGCVRSFFFVRRENPLRFLPDSHSAPGSAPARRLRGRRRSEAVTKLQ
jgi:hypothetical protein